MYEICLHCHLLGFSWFRMNYGQCESYCCAIERDLLKTNFNSTTIYNGSSTTNVDSFSHFLGGSPCQLNLYAPSLALKIDIPYGCFLKPRPCPFIQILSCLNFEFDIHNFMLHMFGTFFCFNCNKRGFVSTFHGFFLRKK